MAQPLPVSSGQCQAWQPSPGPTTTACGCPRRPRPGTLGSVRVVLSSHRDKLETPVARGHEPCRLVGTRDWHPGLDVPDIVDERLAQGRLVRPSRHCDHVTRIRANLYRGRRRLRPQDLGARRRLHLLRVVEQLLVELLAGPQADRLDRLAVRVATREPDQVPGEVPWPRPASQSCRRPSPTCPRSARHPLPHNALPSTSHRRAAIQAALAITHPIASPTTRPAKLSTMSAL